jgi:type III secretion protein C
MMKTLRLLLLLISMAFPCLLYASPVPWKEDSYTYYAQHTTLGKALSDFARTFGIQIKGAEGLNEKLDGRFATTSPTDYLQRLAGLYGLSWYYYNGTLYINRSTANITKPIVVGADSLPNVKRALTELGILQPRFGWGELPEQSLVLISGPPSYVSLIEKTMAAIPTSSSGQQVMVFRLKYANVDDRVVTFNDKDITTPGVATIIRQLVSGTFSSGTGSNQSIGSRSQLVEIAKAVRAGTPATDESAGETKKDAPAVNNPLPQTPPANLQRTKSAPSITADARLNALIIKDTADTEPIYQQLVALLDNPTALVQIEAMIVDVDIGHVRDLGINWAFRNGNVSAGFGNVKEATNGLALNVGSGLDPASTILNAGNALISRINLLEQKNNAQVISRPSILTSDNLPALITFNESYYVKVTGEKVANLQQVTAGMTLKVTPRVIQKNGKNHIYLAVDIEDGQLVPTSATTAEGLPGTRTSTINTQAVLTENESLLIGGYIRDKTSKGNSGIPYLSKVPIFGWLFSNKTTDRQRAERLFMITPKIVSLPTDAVASNYAQHTGPAGLPDSSMASDNRIEKQAMPKNFPEGSMARPFVEGTTPSSALPEVQAEMAAQRQRANEPPTTTVVPTTTATHTIITSPDPMRPAAPLARNVPLDNGPDNQPPVITLPLKDKK